MERFDRLTVDSSGTISDLCILGTEHGTDKSPYHTGHHRHPYTAVYSILFSRMRYEPICFGELGILDNSSMRMWRSFFTRAALYGYEFDREKIALAETECLTNTYYDFVDVTDRQSLFSAFQGARREFDVLIDDSTHQFEHQTLFVDVALDFVKPGGMIIVEDVFRGWGEERYQAALASAFPYFSSGMFIETNHAEKFSEGGVEPWYDNDKLLVLFRNQLTRRRNHPLKEANLQRIIDRI